MLPDLLLLLKSNCCTLQPFPEMHSIAGSSNKPKKCFKYTWMGLEHAEKNDKHWAKRLQKIGL